MRILWLFVVIALGIVLFVFGYSNTTDVDVDLFGTPIREPLGLVVIVALAVGAALIAVLALLEGTSMRLENRRLRRDIQRLETENNFLRTQPATPTRREPDALDGTQPTRTGPAGSAAGPSSAPVYGVRSKKADDDEAYTGGSAV